MSTTLRGLSDTTFRVTEYTVPKYLVIDTETTMHQLPSGEWTSMPYSKTLPTIHAYGWVNDARMRPSTCLINHMTGVPTVSPVKDTVVVGHNIGFDFMHLHAATPGGAAMWSLVWDTMIADYILSGQANKFTSLGELMQRELGRRPKDDLIGMHLKLGVPPQDIPEADLLAYLEGDVSNTRDVFLSQWKLASPAQRRLIIVQSRASLVYALCQYNGMRLDVPEAVKRRDKCYAKAERMAQGFMDVWTTALDRPTMADVDTVTAKEGKKWATAPTAMSALFFNVPSALDIGNVPDPATGKRRVRKVFVPRPPVGMPVSGVDSPVSGGKNRIKSTADDILGKIIETGAEPYKSLAEMEQARRGAHKLGTTYYQALLEQEKEWGRIHPKIHATSTNTGRTSASDPNIQNQPPETREVFLPESGDVFYEFDFAQLEVCALAEVSGCELLRAAVESGQDIHYLTGVTAGLWTSLAGMTKEKRTLVKRVNFGLIYGGGAKTLAKQSGVDVKLVQQIIDSFYKTFPGVANYHNALLDFVNATGPGLAPSPFFVGRSTGVTLVEGGTRREVTLMTTTGRSYVFPEEPAPEFMRKRGTTHSISPTKVKNYPIQGFGTADIVPLVLSNLLEIVPTHCWRAVVHDSALLNVPVGTDGDLYVADAVGEAVHQLQRFWNIELSVPLRTSSEYKDRWNPKPEE